MTVAALAIPQLIDAAPLPKLLGAIRTELEGLLPTCQVRAHPGKLDVSDIIGGDIGTLPAVLVGWTAVKSAPGAARDFTLQVDLIAYVAVGDFTDLSAKRLVKREEVGQAICAHILAAVHDDAHGSWGLAGVGDPYRSPAPEMRPVFTATSYSKGVAYYAVTWSQEMPGQGAAIATHPGLSLSEVDGQLVANDEAIVEADAFRALFAKEEEAPT